MILNTSNGWTSFRNNDASFVSFPFKPSVCLRSLKSARRLSRATIEHDTVANFASQFSLLGLIRYWAVNAPITAATIAHVTRRGVVRTDGTIYHCHEIITNHIHFYSKCELLKLGGTKVERKFIEASFSLVWIRGRIGRDAFMRRKLLNGLATWWPGYFSWGNACYAWFQGIASSACLGFGIGQWDEATEDEVVNGFLYTTIFREPEIVSR